MNKKIREAVYEKYNGHCAYCGREIKYNEMQVDHFHAKDRPYKGKDGKWKRADDSLDNLMPSCRRCNHYKRANSLEIYRRYLKEIKRKLIDDTYLGKVAQDYNMVTWNGWNGIFYFEYFEEVAE